MFSYYGAKWRALPHYRTPVENLIIEPFCGSAMYALTYYQGRKVHLNDLDPTICQLWDYLIHASAKDILSLPIDTESLDHVDALNIPAGAKSLIGFWLCKAYPAPVTKRIGWAKKEWDKWHAHYWSEGRRKRVSEQVGLISKDTWKITNLSYDKLENRAATWFVDPPYQNPAGKHYVFNNSAIDFGALGQWCQSRNGQVIVCENAGANWLPFETLGSFRSAGKNDSAEVVWYKGGIPMNDQPQVTTDAPKRRNTRRAVTSTTKRTLTMEFLNALEKFKGEGSANRFLADISINADKVADAFLQQA